MMMFKLLKLVMRREKAAGSYHPRNRKPARQATG
jgi:hypothetical protein